MTIDEGTTRDDDGPPRVAIGEPVDDGGGSTLRLAYRGQGGDLFLVFIKNVFLTLVTLGIYAPWARTARRQYLWRQVEIDGQRLEYTGTGLELFIGYVKLFLGYLVFAGIPAVAGVFSKGLGSTLRGVAGVVILCVLPFALYWSRRYLLGRTLWRGIRFGLAGDATAFAKVFLKGSALTVLTLGLYAPVMGNRVYGFVMGNTRYGSASFSYDGPDREAFKIGLKGFFLTLLTLGIYLPWYTASVQRFRLAHTRFAGAAGSFDVTGGLLLKLLLVNILGNVLTLGLAFPWTTTYTLRTLLPRLSFSGAVDFAQITQRGASGDAAGDTLAGALGVELGI